MQTFVALSLLSLVRYFAVARRREDWRKQVPIEPGSSKRSLVDAG